MEATIRLLIFVAIFAAIAALEFTVPRRPRTVDWRRRWAINLSILAIDVIVQRLTLGAAAFATALYAEAHGWGLFGLLAWPWWIEAAIAFIILDFAIYLQHVLFHALPVFWRLHQVHHADLDVDLTTGTRFHPVEILISLIYKAGLVAALGADPWAVLAFEAVLNGAAIFSHGNIHLPQRLEGALRRVVVTPDMHRIHHSVIAAETNSNYGFFLSVWDRLGGTFRQSPAKGQEAMELGLPGLREPGQVSLAGILLLPFRRR
ncbi:MAG: sterol desaturase family protein [Alphaproteobacteria bacterium]|nr:sterol desaturase family protein [Alphaproteobacteria bacterium]